MPTAIEFNNISKLYRLGLVSTGTLAHDLKRWWTINVRRKEDPYLKIGETNDRSTKGDSDYVWALKDIDFKVEQGDVVGIIGKNGAGKSTLLKLLSKVTAPTTGEIRAKGRIGSLLEVGTGFHPEMTGRENIYMNGAILGMTKAEITKKLDEIVDFSGCERYIDTPVKRYSSGMMVRLGFAVAAHLDPEILVVDEVLAVGDAEFQKKAIGKMKDVSRGEGRSVLFVSHNMDAVLSLCRNGVLLENGAVKYMGSAYDTVAQYLRGNQLSFNYENDGESQDVFVSSVSFVGNESNVGGVFLFDENIHIKATISRKENAMVDTNLVAGICIKTESDKMVCFNEFPLKDLQGKRSISFDLTYPAGILIPGDYKIHIALHIPNVKYVEQQDTVKLTICDSGSEYIKYKGANNGVIILRPEVGIDML